VGLQSPLFLILRLKRSEGLEFKGGLKNISNREKALITGALALLVIFLIYQFVFVPLLRAREEYQNEKIELENQLSNVKILAERYVTDMSYYKTVTRSLRSKKAISVLTYIENESQSVGIRDNIEYVRPKGSESKGGIVKSSVEMKIDAIAMRDLLLFLMNIEKNRDGLIVTYLRLKPFFKEKEKVDAVVGITDVTVE